MPTALLKLARTGLAAAAGLLPGAAALGQRPAAPPAPAAVRFEIRPPREGGVLLAAFALDLAPRLLEHHLPYATCAPCARGGLWGIDRFAVGVVDTGWARASNVALAATGAATALFLWTARRGESDALRSAIEDGVVLAQAAGLADAAAGWLKIVVQRPRPPRYTGQAALYRDPEYGLSFPSGHATLAFSAAAAYWSIQRQRGQARGHAVQIATLFALAGLTAAARVEAHAHFPTDVLAGAALGTAVGWAWPRLHPRRRPPA